MPSSVNFTIRISPYMNIVSRTTINKLKYRKINVILNRNRFLYDDVLTEMIEKNKDKKKQLRDILRANIAELLFLMD